MPVGATIASVGGKIAQGVGAQSAANAAKTAANQAIGFDKGVYSDTQQALSPYITSGASATGALNGILNGDPAAFNKFRNSTNYQFLFDQGRQAVATSHAPSLISGATGKALTNYGQGMAGNALAAYTGLLNGQQQLGEQAGFHLGALGNQTGNLIGDALGFGAKAQGAANIAGGNAVSGALNDVIGGIQQARTQSSFGGGGNGGGGNGGIVISGGSPVPGWGG
jgi:hypothetical protein